MTTPAAPDPSTPTTTSVAPATTSTVTPDTSTATRDLATTLSAPTPIYASLVKAVVTANANTAAPPTISIQISGDTSTTVDGVRYIDSYSPVVGDTVLVGKQDADMFVLGQMNDSGTGTAQGWQTPALGAGFTTNGNTNGAALYRIVLDNGELKMQWKGSVAVSGTPTAICTVPTGFRPAAKRSISTARDPGGGSNIVQIDFGTDGTVVLVGATTFGNVNGGTTGAVSPGTSDSTTPGATGSATGTTDLQGSHTHVNTDDHTHSHGGAVATTSFADSTALSSGSHTHSVGSHTHTEAAHTHGFAATHAHTFTPTGAVAFPLWVSFNRIEYFLS